MGTVGAGGAEVVVEDLLEDRPRDLGAFEEIPDFEPARVVLRLQAALAAERGDAALDADARAREGGQMLRGADERAGAGYRARGCGSSWSHCHGFGLLMPAEEGSQPVDLSA